MHEGTSRVVWMSVRLPEMKVHARGEDCKDHELKTICGCTFRVLLVGIHSRMWRCLLIEHAVVRVLVRRTSIARSKIYLIDSRTSRSSDVKMFAAENTLGKIMIMDECGKRRVQVLTHQDRMHNRICYDSPGQRTDHLNLSASSVWQV